MEEFGAGGNACAAVTSNVNTIACCGARLFAGGNALVSLWMLTSPLPASTDETKPFSAPPFCVKFATVAGLK